MGFLNDLLYAIDTPGALTRGLLAGKPGKRVSGRELVDFMPNKKGLDAGDVVGFLAEVLVDPMNLVGGAGALKAVKSLGKARKVAKVADTASDIAKPIKAVDGSMAVSKSEGLMPASSAGQVSPEAIAVMEEDMRKGGDWVAQHYKAKIDPKTGQITNPKSGLSLFDYPNEGAKKLDDIANRRQLVAESDKVDSPAYYQPSLFGTTSNEIGFNSGEIKNMARGEVQSAGVHEHMHALTDSTGNMNSKLHNFIYDLAENTKVWRGRQKNAVVDDLLRKSASAREYVKEHGVDGYQNLRKRLGEFQDYVTSPEETIARVVELRKAMGPLGPDDFTKELATGALKDVRAVTDLRQTYPDATIRKLLRYMPAAIPVGASPFLYQAVNSQGDAQS